MGAEILEVGKTESGEKIRVVKRGGSDRRENGETESIRGSEWGKTVGE